MHAVFLSCDRQTYDVLLYTHATSEMGLVNEGFDLIYCVGCVYR